MNWIDERDLKIYPPPKKWAEFGLTYGVTKLFLITNGETSFHFDNTIYVNIRRDKWKYYSIIIDVRNFEEAMTCKFLHEIGHIVLNHKNISFKTALEETEYDLEIAVERVSSNKIFENHYEKEAWHYVFEFRARNSGEFMELVEAFRSWLHENMKT